MIVRHPVRIAQRGEEDWGTRFSYGTMPRVATADGSDKIPSEMFSATITVKMKKDLG